MGSTRETSRRRRFLTILTLTLALLPRPILAQQEAGIIGQVTDDTGAVLPGVTVTATSPALQVPEVTDVTNERGEYRLSPLPIGTYTVEYTACAMTVSAARSRAKNSGGRIATSGCSRSWPDRGSPRTRSRR